MTYPEHSMTRSNLLLGRIVMTTLLVALAVALGVRLSRSPVTTALPAEKAVKIEACPTLAPPPPATKPAATILELRIEAKVSPPPPADETPNTPAAKGRCTPSSHSSSPTWQSTPRYVPGWGVR